MQRLKPSLITLVLVTCLTPLLHAEELSEGNGRKWYKGNLHSHSLWSDGDDYPEMIGLWYKEHGYNFLTLSDHNVFANIDRWIDVEMSRGGQVAYDKLIKQYPKDWVQERTQNDVLEVKLKKFAEISELLNQDGSFLMVPGEEITDGYKNFPVHMNVSNVQKMIPPMKGNSVFETMQNNVNAALAQRQRTGVPMMIHLNHPNFHYSNTAEDIMKLIGENFFEVFNGHPSVHNNGQKDHASTARIWDIINTRRITELKLPLMYGIASDDGHSYHNIPSPRSKSEPGRGWVMVLAEQLKGENLVLAMDAGEFYSSSGVTLNKIVTDDKGMTIEVAPEGNETYTIEFIGTRKGYDRSHKPILDKKGNERPLTHSYSDDLGMVFETVKGTKAHYSFTEDDLYVRALIKSSADHPNQSEEGDKKSAWVQPVYGPAGKKLAAE